MRISSILGGLTIIGAGALTLAACTKPSPMPTGYTYHRHYYKTPPAPPAAPIGYDYSAPANSFVMGMWHDIAAELVGNLESAYGLSPQEIFVKPPFLKGAQTQSLDYSLRQVLADKGYTITPFNPNILTLSFEIKELPEEQKAAYENALPDVPHGDPADFGPKLILLYLDQTGSGRQMLQETHVVPNFGHLPDHGGKKLIEPNPAFGRAPDEIYTPTDLRPQPYNP